MLSYVYTAVVSGLNHLSRVMNFSFEAYLTHFGNYNIVNKPTWVTLKLCNIHTNLSVFKISCIKIPMSDTVWYWRYWSIAVSRQCAFLQVVMVHWKLLYKNRPYTCELLKFQLSNFKWNSTACPTQPAWTCPRQCLENDGYPPCPQMLKRMGYVFGWRDSCYVTKDIPRMCLFLVSLF